MFPCTYIDFYHLIHGLTKLSTSYSEWLFLLLHDRWLSLAVRLLSCRADSLLYNINVVSYSIPLGIINYRFYLLIQIHPDTLLLVLLLLILPMQNNKSIKAPFTGDVWKIQYLGWGLVQLQHSAFSCAVFVIRPHSSYCIFRTSLAMVL